MPAGIDMRFDSHNLASTLADIARDIGEPQRLLVAVSGGMDSMVLLHALTRAAGNTPLIAVHVNHGLNADAPRWAEQVERGARSLGVEFRGLDVTVRPAGEGLEAAARTARYAALEAELKTGDWLLTAHHRDDQAETFLLHAVRGSGVRGLAAMRRCRTLGSGLLVRPLLEVPRAALQAYALEAKLVWSDDPANDDLEFDRNYLRDRVLPALTARWPQTVRQLSVSAALARRANDLLDELAALDLEALGGLERLPTARLRALSNERQINALRFALRELELPPAPAAALHRIVTEVLPARVDAEPMVSWRGAEARRYRERLYLLRPLGDVAPLAHRLKPGETLALGGGLGQLRLLPGAPGIDPELALRGLRVDFRRGGERLRPRAGGRTRKLKTLMQEMGVVPWMRARIPLLLDDGHLVAVGDLWCDADTQAEQGYVVRWEQRPLLR